MRVALYHNLPPGGALRVLHEFVRRSHTEHEYDLYTVDLGRFDDFSYAQERAEQHDLTPWVANSYRYPVMPPALGGALPRAAWTLSALAWMERAQRRIAADINGRGYDVAVVHPCRITHTPSLMCHLNVPSLHVMHEYRRRSFEAGYQTPTAAVPRARRVAAAVIERALRRSDRAAVQAADSIICNSHYTAECIRRSYGRDATVCYPGVDTDVFHLGAERHRRPAVLSVGALEPFKGQDLVVRALGLLPEATRPVLDLVYERCDAAYRSEVEALAVCSGVVLRLNSGISDAELARMYRTASATVVTARLEPLGLVPLESLACGTPVVAIREAGYRETVVDGMNGYLVDRSEVSIAEAITRIVAGSLQRTPEELRQTVVGRWSWDGAVKRQLEQIALAAAQP